MAQLHSICILLGPACDSYWRFVDSTFLRASLQAFVKANEACLLDTTGAACLNIVSKPTPNESGPGQPSAPPITPIPEAPAESGAETGPVNSPPRDDDYDEAGSSNQVPMGPGDSAASPAPEAAIASPSPSPAITMLKPAAAPVASTKSSATTKQLMLVLSVLSPLLCSAMLLA
jgi:hypothetical protein